jgi:hypothetical protein
VGYQRKVYSLKWAPGHDLHGLEVSLTGMSIRRMAKLDALIARLAGTADTGDKLAAADEMFHEMAACLVAWNLEDHAGNPVPATYEGLADQDIAFIGDLAATWMGAAASVDIPLPQPSNGGGNPMPEESIPMAALSPSLPN